MKGVISKEIKSRGIMFPSNTQSRALMPYDYQQSYRLDLMPRSVLIQSFEAIA